MRDKKGWMGGWVDEMGKIGKMGKHSKRVCPEFGVKVALS
jgi:hypothetical protein